MDKNAADRNQQRLNTFENWTMAINLVALTLGVPTVVVMCIIFMAQ